MQYTEISPEEAKAHTLRLLKLATGHTLNLATLAMDGYPDLRSLVLCAHDGLDALWFGTSTKTSKVAQLKHSHKSAVLGLGTENGGEFRLYGETEMHSDSASRRRVWQDGFLRYFPDGVDSPDFVVLKLIPARGEYRAQTETSLIKGEFCLRACLGAESLALCPG